MSEASELIKVNCTYCGKILLREEMVRYRGAISCRSCAIEAQERDKQKIAHYQRWFTFGAVGSLVGVFIATFIQWSGILFFTPEISYVVLAAVILMQVFAVYGLYLISDQSIVLASIVAGGFTFLTLISEYIIFPILIPIAEIDNAIITGSQIGMVAFFIITGLVILLTRQHFESESLTAGSGALYLTVGSTLFRIPFAPTLLFAFTTLLFAGGISEPDLSIRAL
ncbi:MAG: hypothetical protein ACXADC_05345 [Candidatus Thorarchaeota archaeon]